MYLLILRCVISQCSLRDNSGVGICLPYLYLLFIIHHDGRDASKATGQGLKINEKLLFILFRNWEVKALSLLETQYSLLKHRALKIFLTIRLECNSPNKRKTEHKR